ncbi:MAG: alpha/beta hydrolase [Arachidicoccus sp.]|nr:alpha/beta hydrolase [Arachidicoccus sp.]
MKKFFILFAFLSLFIIDANAQNISTVYLSKNDTTKNMFVAIMPNDGIDSIKTFMFLINGMFSPVRDVLQQTDLPVKAAQQRTLVIIPLLETGIQSFGIDDSSQNSLKNIIDYCVDKYHLQSKPFYLGGYSIGGACVVKYAELAVKNNYPEKPNAVFAIDPPLDFERFYNSAKRNLRLMKGIYENPENKFMVAKLEQKMQGSPQTALQNFYKMSPYSYSDTTQSAVKFLSAMPITIYTEPNITWWMNNRAFDYSNINCIDIAAMINELHLLGNQNARFIPTENKGFRKPNNEYHPHSWSIADMDELLSWLENFK